MLERDTVAPDVKLCDSRDRSNYPGCAFTSPVVATCSGQLFQKRRSSEEWATNFSNKDSSQVNDTVALTLCYALILAKENQQRRPAPVSGVLRY